ncbi:MAG: site-specific integrase [Lachnospiraceae bacterium]|nr:site-specific integrase [Lachnospiraceae bacterium]
MASIRKRGNTYQITVSNGYDINGKKITETTTCEPTAKTAKKIELEVRDFAFEFEKKVKSGKYISGDKMTFADFTNLWFAKYADGQLADTSISRAKSTFNVILPYIGHKKISALQPLDFQNLYVDLQNDGYTKNGKTYKYSNNTIKRMRDDLSSILNTAIDWRLIADNPVKGSKPPKVERNNSDIKYFTPDEAKKFLDFLDKDYTVVHRGREKADGTPSIEHITTKQISTQIKSIIYMAIFGGFRRGELVGFSWSAVDFDNNCISVNKTAIRPTGGQKTKDKAKAASSTRTVSLPPLVMDLLKKHKAEQTEYKNNLGTAWNGMDWLYIQDDGKQMDIDTPNKQFKKIIVRYNNDNPSNPLPVINLHCLRHTCATLAIAANANIKSVSARLGHADINTTLDIYECVK